MAIVDLLPRLKGSIPASIYAQLPGILPFGIDGPKRLSNFLGQCAHESANFTRFTENLNYSAQGLLATFPKYFDVHTAAEYARQPERIANRVYGNRLGNGPESSGDGWRYRGRGALQTTGHDNYKALGDFLHVDLLSNPDLVATDYALASAAYFFKVNNLWSICDGGIDDATITKVTKRVNGGTSHLDERIALTRKFYRLLTS